MNALESPTPILHESPHGRKDRDPDQGRGKRLDTIERSIENLKKDSNSNDAGAQIKALGNKLEPRLEKFEPRLDKLEAAVKELGIQMVLKKDLKTATKLEADDWDREAKARGIRAEAEAKARVDKETAARLAEMKEHQARIDKMVTEQMLNSRFAKIEAELGTRVKVLETQVAIALSKR
ncbi:MAG: hypothetical protein ACXWJA_02985 [Caldimonas sp.]